LSLTILFFKHDELLALDPMFLGFVYNSLYCDIGKNLILNNETKKIHIYIIFLKKHPKKRLESNQAISPNPPLTL
jgi:hypothetical protein